MMQLPVKSKLSGELTVPSDKSISHRAVLFSSLAKGKCRIRNFLESDDCLSTIACMRQLGVNIEQNGTEVLVEGGGLHGLKPAEHLLYTGNSGTTTRLLTGILCGQPFCSEIGGDESVGTRPMNRIIQPLSQMGAKIRSRDGFCPMTVSPAKLHGISYRMLQDSAQVKSAILLAGLYAEGATVVMENNKSRDHSERMLSAFGCKIASEGTTVSLIPPEELYSCDIEVVGDISSAAFFLVAGAVLPHSCITIKNVGMNPTRTGIIDVLLQMGADISIENERIIGSEPAADLTVRSSELKGISFGAEIIPRLIDEIPVLAVAAAAAEGKTVITGAQELKVKETNRIDTVCLELQKAGVDITPTEDGMIIDGGKAIRCATFDSHGDHRIAMACAVLALLADRPCELAHPECVSVSFPRFFEFLSQL